MTILLVLFFVVFWGFMYTLTMLFYELAKLTKSVSLRRGASTWFWGYLLSNIALFPLSRGETWRVIRLFPGAAWLLDTVKVNGRHITRITDGDSLIIRLVPK